MSKVALICGYGDVGTAIAKKMSDDGYEIAVMSRNSGADSGYSFFKCDITDRAAVNQAVDEIIEKFTQIDVLVCTTASEIKRKNVLDLSLEELKEDFETNFFGVFNVLKAVGEVMKKNKAGSIVVVTSAVTEINVAHGRMGGYISAKHALKGLLQQMNQELSSFGITVNAIAPGFMRTKLNKDIPERMDDFLKEKNPTKRLVTPEEVAGLIVSLCSEKSKHLTGLSLLVNGGESLQL